MKDPYVHLTMHCPLECPTFIQLTPLQNFLSQSEMNRCNVANRLISFLTPSSPAEPNPKSLFNLTVPKEPVLFPVTNLPPSTLRIIESSSFTLPSSVSPLPGGLDADPLLTALLERSNIEQSYLGTSFLPPAGSDPGTIATLTQQRTVVRMTPYDALLCSLFEYASRQGRVRLAPSIEWDAMRPLPSADARHAMFPLGYRSISYLRDLRPWLEALFWTNDVHCSTTLPFGKKLSDRLYLSALISYWCYQVHPYCVPLPTSAALDAAQSPVQTAPVPSAPRVHSRGPGLGRNRRAPMNTPQLPSTTFDRKTDWLGTLNALSHWRRNVAVDIASSIQRGLQTVSGTLSTSHGASREETQVNSWPAYSLPSGDLLEGLYMLTTMQLVDFNFHNVVAGATPPPMGGPSLLHLADAFIRSRYPLQHVSSSVLFLSDLLGSHRTQSNFRSGNRSFAAGAGVSSTAAAGVDVAHLHQSIGPGSTVLQEAWYQLSAPLFHFIRNHLTLCPLDGTSASNFASIVDVWLVAIAPWRARDRYKRPFTASETYRDTMRSPRFRQFNFSEAGSLALEEEIRSIRSARIHSQRMNAAEHMVVDTPLANTIAQRVRSRTDYLRTLFSATDYEGKQLAADCTFPWKDWIPWIRLHAPWYFHLLGIFLSRMKTAFFADHISAQKTLVAFPVLLETLERVLDVFEPSLVRELTKIEEIAHLIFQSPTVEAPNETFASAAALRNPSVLQTPRAADTSNLLSLSFSSTTVNRLFTPHTTLPTRTKPAVSAPATSLSPDSATGVLQILAGLEALRLPTNCPPAALFPSLRTLHSQCQAVAGAVEASAKDPRVPRPPAIRTPGHCTILWKAGEPYTEHLGQKQLFQDACLEASVFVLYLPLLAIRCIAHWRDGFVLLVRVAMAFLLPLFALLNAIPSSKEQTLADSTCDVIAAFLSKCGLVDHPTIPPAAFVQSLAPIGKMLKFLKTLGLQDAPRKPSAIATTPSNPNVPSAAPSTTPHTAQSGRYPPFRAPSWLATLVSWFVNAIWFVRNLFVSVEQSIHTPRNLASNALPPSLGGVLGTADRMQVVIDRLRLSFVPAFESALSSLESPASTPTAPSTGVGANPSAQELPPSPTNVYTPELIRAVEQLPLPVHWSVSLPEPSTLATLQSRFYNKLDALFLGIFSGKNKRYPLFGPRVITQTSLLPEDYASHAQLSTRAGSSLQSMETSEYTMAPAATPAHSLHRTPDRPTSPAVARTASATEDAGNRLLTAHDRAMLLSGIKRIDPLHVVPLRSQAEEPAPGMWEIQFMVTLSRYLSQLYFVATAKLLGRTITQGDLHVFGNPIRRISDVRLLLWVILSMITWYYTTFFTSLGIFVVTLGSLLYLAQ